MATFEITDQKTGIVYVVEGNTPPTPADVDFLLSQQAPPAAAPSLATPAATGNTGTIQEQMLRLGGQGGPTSTAATTNPYTAGGGRIDRALRVGGEFGAGFNRPLAALADVAVSPYTVFMELQGKPVPSISSMVPKPGSFMGNGLSADIAGKAGEFTSSALMFSQGLRSLTTSLLDDSLRYGETAWRGVLKQLGSATPADDILAATTAAMGAETAGAVGEKIGGTGGRAFGEFFGGLALPAAALPVLTRLAGQVAPLIREAAPDVEQLRGASRAGFKLIEDMGITYTESATRKIADELQAIATKESLTDLRGESALATQYKKVRSYMAEAKPGESFNGVTFSVLDKAKSAFSDIGAGTDNEARIARLMAKQIDEWLMNGTIADVSIPAVTGTQLALNGAVPPASSAPPAVESVGKLLTTSRALWRRAAAGQAIDDAIKDAQLASLGAQGQNYEQVLVENLRTLLRSPETAGVKFTKEENALIAKAIQGGGVRHLLDLTGQVGIKSNDLVKGVIYGLGGAAMAGQIPSSSAVAGSALIAISAGVSKIAQKIAANLLRGDVNTLNAFIKAGPDAQAITKMYMGKVPQGERKVAELSALFRASGANTSQLRELPMAKSSFISDALAFTQAWEALDKDESTTQK